MCNSHFKVQKREKGCTSVDSAISRKQKRPSENKVNKESKLFVKSTTKHIPIKLMFFLCPRGHQWQRVCLPMQETQETRIDSLGLEAPLEEKMATHSSIFTWRIPWTEAPGGPQSTGSQRVRHDWATEHTYSEQIIPGKKNMSQS